MSQQTREAHLPYQVLTSKDGIYFSSVVLSMWDNIHGPKVLMTWKGTDCGEKLTSSYDGSEEDLKWLQTTQKKLATMAKGKLLAIFYENIFFGWDECNGAS